MAVMRTMKKVMHIITRLDRGGSAENTMQTCLGLADRYELILAHGLSLESHMSAWEKETVEERISEARQRGVKVKPLPPLVRRLSPTEDVKAFFALWKLIRQERPHIVHTHSSKAGILGRLAAWLARVPVIIHTPHGHVFYGHFGRSASRVFLWVERFMDRFTDHMIALTEAEKADYIRLGVSRAAKVTTIHSGVALERFMASGVDGKEKRTALGLSPEGLVVGTVGWLLPIKGPQYLIQAMPGVWENHPETTLVFVGKGELEEALREKAVKMGASDRVRFPGWRDDIPEIMHALDVFVLPSLNEGMGRVLVEAMAAGKPVVASWVGGILDLVRDGDNGFLVSPGDVKGLSRALNTLLGDRELRRRMGQRGRALVGDFSVEGMVEKIDTVYAALLAQE